ncbi:MAG: TonB-dependent receptor [Gammaproteobacteria bacterium]|nr:TonB-dependent receptor [Gammaproteobacteria bacterium]
MNIHTRGLTVLIVMLSAFEVVAQQGEEEDLALAFGGEEFLSIATGRQQPISKAPAVATVITAEEIKEMGATNLDQVLESVPGLHVSLSSVRFSPVYSVRGIHTDSNPQVLMLLNGVPLTQVFFGDRGPNSTLPAASIQRVEVIRGPGSAVYGADAFAGVINVITKSAADIDGTEAGVRVESFDTKGLWLLHGGELGGFDVAFSLEASTTDGDEGRIIQSDAQSFFDSLSGTSASLAPGPADTREERVDIRLELSRDQWTARLWNWRQSDGGVGPGLAQALDPEGVGETDNYLFDVTYREPDISQFWDLTARASYMDINTRSRQTLYPAGTILRIGTTGALEGNIDPAGGVPVVFTNGLIGNPEVYEQHARFDLSSFYTGFDNHHLRLAGGVHYVELDPKESKNFGPGVIDGATLLPFDTFDGTLTDVTGTPYAYMSNEDRTVYYASLQDEWSLAPDWELTAGLRYDHYSDFGSTVNPRLALVWNTRHDLTTKFLYGRAFRAPSFAELYDINNPVILGNPDLVPESINTGEIAFDYRPTFDLQTGLNLFAYQIDDMIRFAPDPGGGTSTAQNTSGQRGYGFELEAEWDLSEKLSLGGNYAYQHATEWETGSAVPNAPAHQIYLNGKWRFLPDWLVAAQLNWVGDRPRAENDPRADISDYTLVDLVVRNTRGLHNWQLALGVRNLFDKTVYEPSPAEPGLPAGAFIPDDYPLAGRSFYAEAQYKF